MCSIFFSNKPNINLDEVNRFIKMRGPDHTEVYQHEGLLFIHNLLSISGAFRVQPFVDENIIAMFNGEIYNYQNFGSYSSDGECLIPAYKSYGSLFPQIMDGEFAIILVDLTRRSAILATDVFATKPLYFASQDKYFAVATYESALIGAGFSNIIKLPANTIFNINLDQPILEKIGCVYNFSLKQYRKDFDGWIESFELAVKKRAQNCREKIFIGLSGGYDSGAISCALNKYGYDYNAYSVIGKERNEVLINRAQLMLNNGKHEFIYPSPEIKNEARHYIDNHVERLFYKTYSSHGDYNEFNLALHDDNGATGLSMVCNNAKKDNCKIYLSGQGADEIISDYGFNGVRIYAHSNFGGLFPENLEDVFPWPSFYGSSQESYLMKEEHVAGSYGIEARYPFLDKRVVQEFLALDSKLKNSAYKSALRVYLERNNFPCHFDEKIGF